MSGAWWACDPCLRRTWLLARLAGHLEVARLQRQPIRDVLGLSDARLVAALVPDPANAAAILTKRDAQDPEALRRAAAAHGIGVACRHAGAYPHRLTDDPGGAAVLHALGAGRLASLVGDAAGRPPAVAIVGARNASVDGTTVARALGRGLSAAGVTVVSGMALGIDAAAHEGALEGGGRTVAVLAGGVDVPYPRSRAGLHRQIALAGAVVSEMPPGAGVRRWAFPARNRTIAGLADAVVVVEAAERSGSLITIGFALDLGRDVAAVPGSPLSWRSAGVNALLRDGAAVVRDARDVLDLVVGIQTGPPSGVVPVAPPPDLDPALREILRHVDDGRDTAAALARVGVEAGAALAGLTLLELHGLVEHGSDGRWRRCRAA